MGNFWKHLKTITHHRHLVRRYCFKIGLFRQGLFHDLSKYSPSEFWVGVRYYQGDRSPNDAERRATGLSKAWLHHKGRNRHHLEYWVDYDVLNHEGQMAGMKMPEKYVAEMLCDRIAASKTYRGEAYTDQDPWDYYDRSKNKLLLHRETREQLEKLLWTLKEEGEEAAFEQARLMIQKSEKKAKP